MAGRAWDCVVAGNPDMTAPADRQLLFGMLALQNGLVNQGQLVAAFQAWTLDKSRSLAEHLEARGDLDADDRAAVEALVGCHLRRHGDDVEKSLAAVPAGKLTQASLARIGDLGIEAILNLFASGHTSTRVEDDRPHDLAPAAFPSARPTATASGSACSGRMPAAGWGRSSWPWTPS